MFYSGIVSQCSEILMAEKQIILKVLNDALLEGGGRGMHEFYTLPCCNFERISLAIGISAQVIMFIAMLWMPMWVFQGYRKSSN